MTRDPITLADEAEERSAADALRAATSEDDLMDAWFVNVSRYFDADTAANARLLAVYRQQLADIRRTARAG